MKEQILKKGKRVEGAEKEARKNVLNDLSKQLGQSIMSKVKKPASPKLEQEAMEEGEVAESETVGDYDAPSEPEFSTEEEIDAQIAKLMEVKAKLQADKSSALAEEQSME